MVDRLSIQKSENEVSSRYKTNFTSCFNRSTGASIFDNANSTQNEITDVEALYAELQEIEEEQGFFQKGFNDIKEKINIGTSNERCEDKIEKFEQGEITFEEAEAELAKYKSKQDSGLNVFANIACSIAAIAAATAAIVATGGAVVPLVLAGAGAGAVTKTAVKTVERATNEVKDDEFDSKKITKDILSGAVTGSIAAYTMGNGSATASFGAAIKKCAITGVKTGAVAGSTNYLIDCGVDGDEFNAKDFAQTTFVNAAVGGTVGAIMGGTNNLLKTSGIVKYGGKAAVESGQAIHASGRDIAANSVCTAEYKILNKTIKDIAA